MREQHDDKKKSLDHIATQMAGLLALQIQQELIKRKKRKNDKTKKN